MALVNVHTHLGDERVSQDELRDGKPGNRELPKADDPKAKL